MQNSILPPATIGILGSGQLGRMLAIAARQLGYRVHVFSPRPAPTPAGQVADKEDTAAYTDLAAVRAFAQGVDVVTYEFEKVPAETAVAAAEFAPLHPGPQALHVAQNRLREKQFFAGHDLPVTPFIAVASLADLQTGLDKIGASAVLKTTTAGYDGKGQVLIRHPGEAAFAWDAIGQRPAILERFVPFEREVSVVAARGQDGRFAHFGVIENNHHNHILDVSTAPANVTEQVAETAVSYARRVLEQLDVVGVVCVEFFLTADNRLLLNEIAPRPHNSGHLTIEACETSQFEQQLRAVCGLPLGDTGYRKPAAMANLLGDLWPGAQRKGAEGQRGQKEGPDWTAVLGQPDVHLHLYDKDEARPGRKMGHLTALGETTEEAKAKVLAARQALGD